MKNIAIKELVNIVAGKLNLKYETDNFSDFRKFIEEVYSQFDTEWDSLENQACYRHNVNVPERIVKVSTEALNAVFAEADSKFMLSGNDAEYFEEKDYESKDSPSEIDGAVTVINYVDNGETSVSEFLSFWQDVCKRQGGEIEVTIGSVDEGAYGKHKFELQITAEKTASKNSFIEFPDNGAAELLDALYWLTENFRLDTFDAFEKLGVELRYAAK